jgi:hypothetical protein
VATKKVAGNISRDMFEETRNGGGELYPRQDPALVLYSMLCRWLKGPEILAAALKVASATMAAATCLEATIDRQQLVILLPSLKMMADMMRRIIIILIIIHAKRQLSAVTDHSCSTSLFTSSFVQHTIAILLQRPVYCFLSETQLWQILVSQLFIKYPEIYSGCSWLPWPWSKVLLLTG